MGFGILDRIRVRHQRASICLEKSQIMDAAMATVLIKYRLFLQYTTRTWNWWTWGCGNDWRNSKPLIGSPRRALWSSIGWISLLLPVYFSLWWLACKVFYRGGGGSCKIFAESLITAVLTERSWWHKCLVVTEDSIDHERSSDRKTFSWADKLLSMISTCCSRVQSCRCDHRIYKIYSYHRTKITFCGSDTNRLRLGSGRPPPFLRIEMAPPLLDFRHWYDSSLVSDIRFNMERSN